MSELLHRRLTSAEQRIERLRNNPTPTVPIYDLSVVSGCPVVGTKVLKVDRSVSAAYVTKTISASTPWFMQYDLQIPLSTILALNTWVNTSFWLVFDDFINGDCLGATTGGTSWIAGGTHNHWISNYGSGFYVGAGQYWN